jgi:hypothetical protein
MSASLDPSLAGLNSCGCCAGAAVSTPGRLWNRPGLSAIAYRVATYDEFVETLLTRISASRLEALKKLTTRDRDDFSMALLDAFSVMADVLTFYQERIANEAYLRTATERVSVLELARLIDYQLRRGVAASTYLAFTIEDAPGAFGQALVLGAGASKAAPKPPPVPIEAGVKVQSVPGPGETAQTYETVEEIEARAEWNAMRPRLSERQVISTTLSEVLLDGLATNLRAGDGLILVADSSTTPVFRQVTQVVTETIRPKGNEPPIERTRVRLASPVSSLASTTAQPGVYALRARASVFGHNAPPYEALPASLREEPFYAGRSSDWVENNLDEYPGEDSGTTNVFLDAVYAGIAPNSLAVLKNQTKARIYRVLSVVETSKADFTLSGKTTRLTLNVNTDFDDFPIRQTTVYGESEMLALARKPITTVVFGLHIDLDGAVGGLKPGQKLILCGEPFNQPGESVCEMVEIDRTEELGTTERYTRIVLKKSLTRFYLRDTVTINGNVAPATHGETVQEVLGSGDGAQTFQRFVLRQSPLTYVSSSSATGADSTLEVRVNDVLWREAASLFGTAPEDQVYITRLNDESKTTVIFGDGRTGARLPTGDANVTAKYRKGIGVAGQVKADQLSQLMSRPLGVKGVTNPLDASGAQDAETLDEARRNAPLAILTLGRVVSLQDYEDFAQAFLGVGKAKATWTWNGENRGVFLTITGVEGASLPETGNTFMNLLDSLRANGDATVPLTVKSTTPRYFRLVAKVKVDPKYTHDKVLAQVEESLREEFSFDAREFGQPVTASEVLEAMHAVRGVVAVQLTALYRLIGDEPGSLHDRLPAALPRAGAEIVEPAELLILDTEPVSLGVLS